MVKASSAAASDVDQQAEHHDRETGKRQPEGQRLARLHAAHRHRTARGARHDGVDVGVVPHVERAGGAGADRDAEQRGEADQRMQRAGRDRQADQRGEHHQRHHPRLHQRDVVADAGQARFGKALLNEPRYGGYRTAEVCAFADERHYLIRGSVSN